MKQFFIVHLQNFLNLYLTGLGSVKDVAISVFFFFSVYVEFGITYYVNKNCDFDEAACLEKGSWLLTVYLPMIFIE